MVFFESCKFVIKSQKDYLEFANHFMDVLHASSGLRELTGEYPMYVTVDSVMRATSSYLKTEFKANDFKYVDLPTFLSMKYIVSYHFRTRFDERFETSSDTRFKKLVRNMLKRGTWLKRKDAIQVLKYKKTSCYVLYSQYEGSKKIHYLIVLTDDNILTTIYEFDIKDLKFFREI